MPETTTPQLTEREVEEIAREPWVHSYGDERIEAPAGTRRVLLTVQQRNALIRDWRALQAEREAAMIVLAPSMPENGLEDACRQRMQAYVSERDNCEALEQINIRLSTGLVNIYHVITGEACPHGVALGMATSAVSSMKSENAALREQLEEAKHERDRARTQLTEAEKVLKAYGWTRR